MTVTTTLDRQDFPGDGVNKNFPFNFKFFENAQILVYLISPDGGVIGQTLNVDYSISGAGAPGGGMVVMSIAPPVNYKVYVQRVISPTQPTSIRNQGAFFPAIHEDVFDRLTMLIQQADSNNKGTLRVAIGDPEPARLPSVANRANLLLSFDPAGNPIAVAPSSGSAAALALLLSSPAGASNVFGKLNAVGSVAQSIQAYMSNKIFVGQFGAVCDGVTDDGPAIRRAMDAVPAGGGGIGWPDWSSCKVLGKLFIPQRMNSLNVDGQGINLYGNNCTIIGDGGIIFESGTGTKSTVSLGGASNWGIGDELPTTIHYNSSIQGFRFKNFSTAMKLKNFIQGCSVSDCYASDFTGSMLWTSRSFYLSQTNLNGRPFRNDRADSIPIFRHDGFNNTMSFTGVHGSGIGPNGLTHGTGIGFDGGVEGLVLGNGLSFEGCKHGILLNSLIYSLHINGVYFELCDYGIRSIAANINHMDVDNCRFNSCSTNINVDNWLNGRFGASNDTQSGLVVFGTGCTHDVHLPSQTLSDLNHMTWVRAPVGWTIPAGCQVHRNDVIFNSAVGFSGVWFRNDPRSSGNTGIVPMSYTGDCFNVGGIIPYCLVTLTTGVVTIDTKIAWNPNLASVRFDVNVIHSQSDTISGWLTCDNKIRLDPGNPAGITVVASNNGGLLRLVMSGFSVGGITGYSGKVRIV